jgi:regulator of replication initiation timing
LKVQHASAIKEMQTKITQLEAKKTSKENITKLEKSFDGSESDIFEGLNEDKKDKIMAEVAELYEANITLHYENTLLKKKLEKYGKGEVLGGEKADSMNVETEEDIGDNLYEFGSYTDNDELGNSHYDESVGSIHNIFVDPNSESYKKEKAREK